MDFDYILSVASQNQDGNNVQKRYSLQAGPPKKDPRSKGVNPAAVQALLKKQQNESRQKEIKKKKEKEELLAKRVELKSDRKARAMASRTKDNFRGYNGIPVVEGPKKRKTKLEMQEERSMNQARVGFRVPDPEDDEDNYEYEQTDSETEQEPEPQRPDRNTSSSSKLLKKSTGPPKPPPTHLNFAELLKLAEKKQFEPVELKPKVVKKEERLRTAEEIRELELERKAKRLDKDRDPKVERQRDSKPQSSTSSRKGTLEKEQRNSKFQKNVSEKSSLASDMGKRPNPSFKNDKGHSSSKPSVSDRERPKMSHGDRDRPKTSMSSSSSAINNKFSSKATSSQVSGKQMGPKPSSSHKSNTSSDLTMRKESSSLHGRPASSSSTRPSGTPGQKSQQSRPIQGALQKQGTTLGPQRTGKGELQRQSNSAVRPSLGGAGKPNQPQARPTGSFQAKPGGASQPRPGGSGLKGHIGGTGARPPGIGPGRPGTGGQAPGRVTGSVGSGPGRPKCTVVSETISSKNVGGSRPGVPPRPGMPQRPGMPPRPGMPQRPGMPPRPGMPQRPMNRPPGPMLPPITSAYKRKYEEEEEYDSEMDDFIDDGGDDQEEISRHIKEIFGYDRNKYKEESDYALKFMESSWRDLQKEEARSLRLAVQEDLEEERREEEELKQQNAKRKKRN
ncbi:protein SPT2 homolog isoform X2 [Sphaeramia orbicularis]|uniref:protein SPT2 homolog isoform X2 n=1 Tax=Sphaeramia orbicularis TaxID=375764 RepID=UPI0011811E3A|nr:protein SPT2 homolog isoform X2 [Sphaeramia orbicularis]